jgi:hypothetical protein
MLGKRPAALIGATTVAGAAGFLLVRLLHDVGTKPYFEDEAVAGLISARPFGEVIHTVLWERGGAPLHFALAHAVLSLSPHVETLRALSIACALGVVACSYALGRELSGAAAGAAAAWIAAASGLLRVYGTFGRMYSLLALTGGLAMLLFLRALERPTRLRVSLAAAAGWLLAATHPFGAVPAVAEVAVAAWVWRGRGWGRAVPVLVAAAAALPFAIGELRLAGRFDVSASDGRPLGSSGASARQLEGALRGFAGGGSSLFLLFLALGLVGCWVVVRRSPAVLLVGASALVVPPVLSLLARIRDPSTAFLNPRHLMAALPLWVALVAVGATRTATAFRPRDLRPLAAVAVAVAAVAAGSSVNDPRTNRPFLAATGDARSTGPVGAWLEPRIEAGDLLFPYSVPYLRALPSARHARSLPRGEPGTLFAALGDATVPRRLWVALPLGRDDELDGARIRELRARYVVKVFPRWLLVRTAIHVSGRHALAVALARTVDAVKSIDPQNEAADQYRDVTRAAASR